MAKDDNKEAAAQLKDVIRELQKLQGGNRELLNEYRRAGDELVEAGKKNDDETIDYLREFREQSKRELEKEVSKKLGGQKIDPAVLRTALAAEPHVGKIPDNVDTEGLKKARREPDLMDVDGKKSKKATPAAQHAEHVKAASASPKADHSELPLTANTFKTNLTKIFTKFQGAPAAIRNRYRQGDALAKKTFGAISSLPGKMGDVISKLPVIGGISKFIKSFVGTIGSALATVGALVSLSGFLQGWEKAKEWFGENADFWDKLSAGLAAIVQSFLGLSDEEAKDLATKISSGLHNIVQFVKNVFEDTVNVVKVAWQNVDKAITSFRTLWDGIINGDFGKIKEGLGGIGEVVADVAKAIWDNKLALLPIFYFFSGPILAAASAIAGVVGGVASVVGGALLSAFTGIASFIGSIVSACAPVAAVIGAVVAAVVVIKGIWDGIKAGIDEFKKSGDLLGAVKAGLKAMGQSIIDSLKWIWDAFLDGIASVVEYLPFGKKISAKILTLKSKPAVSASPTPTTTGAQDAEAERRALESRKRAAANDPRRVAPVVIQQSNNNSNTTQVVPMRVQAGMSKQYAY